MVRPLPLERVWRPHALHGRPLESCQEDFVAVVVAAVHLLLPPLLLLPSVRADLHQLERVLARLGQGQGERQGAQGGPAQLPAAREGEEEGQTGLDAATVMATARSNPLCLLVLLQVAPVDLRAPEVVVEDQDGVEEVEERPERVRAVQVADQLLCRPGGGDAVEQVEVVGPVRRTLVDDHGLVQDPAGKLCGVAVCHLRRRPEGHDQIGNEVGLSRIRRGSSGQRSITYIYVGIVRVVCGSKN